MLRKTAVILSILLASMATQVSGLGLGTISADSTLNQPLRVRIEVLKLGGTRLDDQRISASVRQPISPILQAPSRTVAQPFVQPMADDIRPPIATPVSPPLQLVEVSSPREPTAEVEETDTDLIDVAETPEAKTTVVKTINTTVTETVSDIAPQVRPGVTIPEQLDVPQGRLSVVSGNDDVAATDTESSMLIEEENAELDQRIAELEIQLAVQQEEADRAAVERGNLNSRLAEVEAQIVAAEEIIRLQDLQLAALQEGLAQAAEIAAAEAVLQAEAAEAVLQAEIAAPVAPATSLMGNTLLLGFGVVLVILILVVLLLRRNRAAELEDDEFDELAGDEFEVAIEVDEAETVAEQAEDGDSADIDEELDEEEAETETESDRRDDEKDLTATASFLDDLGIDPGVFDGIEDNDEDAADEAVEEASPLPTDEDALGDTESFEADDMALSFDPGGDEAEAESSQREDGPDADEKDEGGEETDNEAETLEADIEEFDADVEEQEEEAEEAAIDDQEITDDAIEIEFDLGEGVAAKADQQEEISADAASASEQETEDLDDDLGFVDNDEMEIEFVDDIEEVQLLPGDESATKLELAYAYQKMGDVEGAKEILLEVIEEGTEEQVTEAGKLLLSLDKLSD
ncbi:MAG: FimV/HubP family polar landmark protein [Pseudohongiellaceae bacterium]